MPVTKEGALIRHAESALCSAEKTARGNKRGSILQERDQIKSSRSASPQCRALHVGGARRISNHVAPGRLVRVRLASDKFSKTFLIQILFNESLFKRSVFKIIKANRLGPCFL